MQCRFLKCFLESSYTLNTQGIRFNHWVKKWYKHEEILETKIFFKIFNDMGKMLTESCIWSHNKTTHRMTLIRWIYREISNYEWKHTQMMWTAKVVSGMGGDCAIFLLCTLHYLLNFLMMNTVFPPMIKYLIFLNKKGSDVQTNSREPVFYK